MKNLKYIILFAIQVSFLNSIKAQSWLTIGNGLGGGEVFGSTTAQPINFITNNTQKAVLLSNGNFGIGAGLTAPTFQLQVLGAIDINTPTTYYSIGGNTVLHNPGARNMFTGVGTGASLTTGLDNVFNGFNAGTANTSGDCRL